MAGSALMTLGTRALTANYAGLQTTGHATGVAGVPAGVLLIVNHDQIKDRDDAIERLRVEAARAALEDGTHGAGVAARSSGGP